MEDVEVNYRKEILHLVVEEKIKHTTKYVEKASDKTLEKIYKNYVTKQLDKVNEQIINTLIKRLSDLMTSLELIDDEEDLERPGKQQVVKKGREKHSELRDALHSFGGIGVWRNLSRETHFEEEGETGVRKFL